MKEENHKILIYDFGGGTFDISIVELRGKTIELICTSGDGHLGGEDITTVLYEHFYKKYKEKQNAETNEKSKLRLRKACEIAKIELSDTEETEVTCNMLEIARIDGTIRRSEFNELIKDIINKSIVIIENLLNLKNIKKEEIKGIILAGGSSRIPKVKESLESEMRGVPIYKTINADEAIVYGAAVYSNLIGKNDENLPQIIDNNEEIVYASLRTPQSIRRSISPSPSPLFNTIVRKENKECIGIGIDLGTTTSLACKCKESNTEFIADSSGKNEIGSCVFYVNENDYIVGVNAKSKGSTDSKSFVYDIKRIIGRRMNDKIVQSLIKELIYVVINDQTDKPLVSFDEKTPKFTKTPEQISADILSYLKKNIEKKIENQKYKVVLTVPAHFTESQRSATQAAADLAGLNVLQLINEPTAAAIAYGLTNNFAEKENTIVVYDFGGGTFDVSIIKVKGKNIELIGSDGDDRLGGSDLTSRIYDYYLKQYKEKSGNGFINAKASHHLRKNCDEAKIHLSEFEEVEVEWNILDRYKIDNTLTRNKFYELTEDLFERTITILDETMKCNNVSKESIDEIVLVGGSSKIPFVTAAISNFLPGVKISKAINPIEAVAQGAAILADDLLRNGENAMIHESAYVYPPSIETTSLLQSPLPLPSSAESTPILNSSLNDSFSIKEKTSHSYGY